MESKILLAQIEQATHPDLTRPDVELNKLICSKINEVVSLYSKRSKQ
jgi:hypothetical protein